MALRKRGPSPHSKYRRARAHVAELEARQATLERSRPRTPGKKGAKTRALNKVRRSLSAARGLLTKARNAIAQGASERSTTRRERTAKRSEAATKGWATRRSRAMAEIPAPSVAPSSSLIWFFDDQDGPIFVVAPDSGDRSRIGEHWNAIATFLESGRTDRLDRFVGKSILDSGSGTRRYFATDPSFILENEAEIDLGKSIYKKSTEVSRFAT